MTQKDKVLIERFLRETMAKKFFIQQEEGELIAVVRLMDLLAEWKKFTKEVMKDES